MLVIHHAINARPTNRNGISYFQLLACLLAVGGGVWVGAQYTGVELEDVAYTALDETEMLDKLPEEWRPELSECPTGDCPSSAEVEQRDAQLREELNGLRLEAATLREAAESGKPFYGSATPEEIKLMREQTIGYWLRLCEVASEVAELDEHLQQAATDATTGHVFDIRRRAFVYGKRAIEAIETDHVDTKAIEAGHRMAVWYGEGAKFYAEAIRVWDGLAGGQRASTAEASLEQSRIHNEKQTDLLRTKLAELNRMLSRHYAADLPTIGV